MQLKYSVYRLQRQRALKFQRLMLATFTSSLWRVITLRHITGCLLKKCIIDRILEYER